MNFYNQNYSPFYSDYSNEPALQVVPSIIRTPVSTISQPTNPIFEQRYFPFPKNNMDNIPSSSSKLNNQTEVFFNSIGSNRPFVISPFNMIHALLPIYDGSKGKVKDELEKRFNFHPQLYNTFLEILNQTKKSDTISIQAIFLVEKKFNLYLSYKNRVNKIALVEQVDQRNSKQSIRKVNKFIEDNTRGIFKNIMNENDSLSDITIVSTIYFKSQWKSQFDKNMTKPETFHSSKPRKVNMMTQRETKHSYLEYGNFQLLEMDYKDDQFSMGFILFKNGSGKIDGVIPYLGHLHQEEIDTVKIPRFQQRTSLNLKKLLLRNGVSSIENMDMHHVGDFKDTWRIDKAIHECFIDVNEEGVEASAFTQISMTYNCVSEPKPKIMFIADRPFTYYIRYKPTNTILFTGLYA